MSGGVVNLDFRVVDGDGHVLEDMEAFLKYIPEPYHSAFVELRQVVAFPPHDAIHANPYNQHLPYRGTVGPAQWIEFLADLNMERTVLYPSRALAVGRIRDVSWAKVLCRAYNDWMKDTYLDYDSRFDALAILPLQDPDAAVIELRRAVEELGMPGAVIPSNGLVRQLGARDYWPVYEEANRLGCCLSIHGGAHELLGLDDLEHVAAVHALGHPFALLRSFAGMVFGQVFDRYPNMRVAFLEGGAAWVLLALERLDESFETHPPYDLTLTPDLSRAGGGVADYIIQLVDNGQLYFGCEGGERNLAAVCKEVGFSPFMYASDYPHEVTNETCKKEIAGLLNSGLSKQACKAILRDNALRFYGLSPIELS